MKRIKVQCQSLLQHCLQQSRHGKQPKCPSTVCVCLVAQSHLTLCDPMDCSPGSSVHGIILTRILEWVAISSSRGSSQPRDWTLCLWHLLHWQADSLLLSHLGKPSVYLPFKEIGKMSSRVTVLFCIPSINIWTFHLLQILSSTLILSVFFFFKLQLF